MRILAVAQHAFAMQIQADGAGKETFGRLAGKEVGDCPIVMGRVGKGLGGQTAAELRRGAAVGGDLVEDFRILQGVGGDGGKGVVFGRRAHQRRPANVDLLDGFFRGHALAGHGGLERI